MSALVFFGVGCFLLGSLLILALDKSPVSRREAIAFTIALGGAIYLIVYNFVQMVGA